MVDMKTCPVENSLTIIGRKWTAQIIGNILHNCVRFNDILNVNPGLTSRILSNRLKSLVDFGIIEKNVINHHPVEINYLLTERGHEVKKLIFDLAMFSINSFPETIFGDFPGALPHFDDKSCLREQVDLVNFAHSHATPKSVHLKAIES